MICSMRYKVHESVSFISHAICQSILTYLDTDGEGMGQRTQHGYIFLLQVLLRPILMVIGFIAAVLMMDLMGNLFLTLYMQALDDAGTLGSVLDLVGLVIAVGVFFTTSVMIVNLSVEMIHVVPDAAMSFIGGQTHSGKVGSRASGEFAQSATAATAAARAFSQQAMGNQRQRNLLRNQANERKDKDSDKPGVRDARDGNK